VDDILPVPVGKDYFAFRAYVQAFRAGDSKGKEELYKAGRAFFVPHGTMVLIREHHPDAGGKYIDGVEVRILDGPKEGEAGWVSAANIKLAVEGINVSPFSFRPDAPAKSTKAAADERQRTIDLRNRKRAARRTISPEPQTPNPNPFGEP
jgi:hypothetical protein